MNRKKMMTNDCNSPIPAKMKNQARKKNMKTSPAATNFVTWAEAKPTVRRRKDKVVRMMIHNRELDVWQDAVTIEQRPLLSAGSIQSSWAKLLVQPAFWTGVPPMTFPFIQAHNPVVLIPPVLQGLPFAVQAAEVDSMVGRIPVVKDIPGGLTQIPPSPDIPHPALVAFKSSAENVADTAIPTHSPLLTVTGTVRANRPLVGLALCVDD
jgi:hypothetical protein